MPTGCRVTYVCTSVLDADGNATPLQCSDFDFDGDFDGTSTDGQLSITITSDMYTDTQNQIPVGEYFITVTGTAVNSLDQLEKTTTFKLTLLDPCNPPASLLPPSTVNQQYTLTDTEAPTYTIGQFTVEPDFCPYFYTWEITNLEQVNSGAPISAITQNGVVFSFRYD